MKRKDQGISRIDSNSTHGWFVRGYKNKKTYSKLFSDKKYGGKGKALIAAREFKEELVLELKKIPATKRARRVVSTDSRNKTGILGVCRLEKMSPSGKLYISYSVTWRPKPGVQKCTSFSVHKYGEKQAFKLAANLRKSKMEEVFQQIESQNSKRDKIGMKKKSRA